MLAIPSTILFALLSAQQIVAQNDTLPAGRSETLQGPGNITLQVQFPSNQTFVKEEIVVGISNATFTAIQDLFYVVRFWREPFPETDDASGFFSTNLNIDSDIADQIITNVFVNKTVEMDGFAQALPGSVCPRTIPPDGDDEKPYSYNFSPFETGTYNAGFHFVFFNETVTTNGTCLEAPYQGEVYSLATKWEVVENPNAPSAGSRGASVIAISWALIGVMLPFMALHVSW